MTDYANTISGLLRKREEMMEAIAQTREHLAVRAVRGEAGGYRN